jgi:hypothetical protein
LHALCSTFVDENGETPFVYEENDLVKDAFVRDLVEILKLEQKAM